MEQKIPYRKYYAPKGKRLGFASGRNEKVDYTIIIESNDGEPSSIGVIKTDYINNTTDGVSVKNVAMGDIIDVIEGRNYGELFFGSEEDLKPLKDLVGNNYVKINIH